MGLFSSKSKDTGQQQNVQQQSPQVPQAPQQGTIVTTIYPPVIPPAQPMPYGMNPQLQQMPVLRPTPNFPPPASGVFPPYNMQQPSPWLYPNPNRVPNTRPLMPPFYLNSAQNLAGSGWPGISSAFKTTPTDNNKISMLTGIDLGTVNALSDEFQVLTNGSGRLDKSRFQTMFLSTIYGPSVIDAENLSNNIFRVFDHNQSGALDFAEYVVAYKAMLCSQPIQASSPF